MAYTLYIDHRHENHWPAAHGSHGLQILSGYTLIHVILRPCLFTLIPTLM